MRIMDYKHSIAPCLLVVGGVVVLQYHSMQFWQEHAGSGIGWAWSLLIELAGLWLWYQPDWSSRLLGAVASLVLLAAPLYQLGSVAVLKMEAGQAAVAAQSAANQQAKQDRLTKLSTLKNSIAKHETTITTYLLNSRQRAGWAAEIGKVQAKLDADKQALLQLVSGKVATVATGLQQLPKLYVTNVTGLFITLFLQCSALVLIQLANIKAMLFLANVTAVQQVTSPPMAEMVAASPTPVVQNNIQVNVAQAMPVDAVAKLQQQCQSLLTQRDMTAAELADTCQVSRAQVSFLLNYKTGGRKPSKAAMAAFAAVV